MAEVIAEFHVESHARARGDDGRFIAGLEAGSIEGAYAVAKRIAEVAAGMAWSKSMPIEAVGGGGGQAEVEALGPMAALQFSGSPPHGIDTDKYSLYNEAEGFPSIMNYKGKPMQVQHVNHPGFKGDRFLEVAGNSMRATGIELVRSFLP